MAAAIMGGQCSPDSRVSSPESRAVPVERRAEKSESKGPHTELISHDPNTTAMREAVANDLTCGDAQNSVCVAIGILWRDINCVHSVDILDLHRHGHLLRRCWGLWTHIACHIAGAASDAHSDHQGRCTQAFQHDDRVM